MNSNNPLYKIKINKSETEHWEWACKNLEIGTWMEVISAFRGASCTYYFIYDTDLLAFKLRFGL